MIESPEQQEGRFAMRASRCFLSKIDQWRRSQDDLPSRAEAVRRLVERGLKNEAPHEGR